MYEFNSRMYFCERIYVCVRTCLCVCAFVRVRVCAFVRVYVRMSAYACAKTCMLSPTLPVALNQPRQARH